MNKQKLGFVALVLYLKLIFVIGNDQNSTKPLSISIVISSPVIVDVGETLQLSCIGLDNIERVKCFACFFLFSFFFHFQQEDLIIHISSEFHSSKTHLFFSKTHEKKIVSIDSASLDSSSSYLVPRKWIDFISICSSRWHFNNQRHSTIGQRNIHMSCSIRHKFQAKNFSYCQRWAKTNLFYIKIPTESLLFQIFFAFLPFQFHL